MISSSVIRAWTRRAYAGMSREAASGAGPPLVMQRAAMLAAAIIANAASMLYGPRVARAARLETAAEFSKALDNFTAAAVARDATPDPPPAPGQPLQ
jgi:hypothetical protein